MKKKIVDVHVNEQGMLVSIDRSFDPEDAMIAVAAIIKTIARGAGISAEEVLLEVALQVSEHERKVYRDADAEN